MTSLLRQVARENALIVAIMAAYVAGAAVAAAWWRFPLTLGLYAPFWLVMAAGAAVFALVRGWAPPRWRLTERFIMAAPVLVAAPAFFSAFTSVKSAIPRIHPYAWDGRLAQADRLLFGDDAWRVLQPWLGHPPVTFVLSLFYSAWHPMLVTVFGLVALSLVQARLRRQALTALMLCWGLLGTAAAVVFSSMGPCFVAIFDPSATDTFAQQRAYLAQADRLYPIFEFAEQKRLMAAFGGAGPALGTGISAMPSMHVAVAVLVALVAWRRRPILGAAAGVYLAVVIVASIHLGWHYAWDSIAAVTGAGAIWLVSGWLTDAQDAWLGRGARAL